MLLRVVLSSEAWLIVGQYPVINEHVKVLLPSQVIFYSIVYIRPTECTGWVKKTGTFLYALTLSPVLKIFHYQSQENILITLSDLAMP